eukprot:TRINITY_DN2597_c0_g1_i1.p1 TRINITY_DN2597_c0_g1~~TRINITY_DN2597_c0_g1_i1.p1  ORF type:complete len:683 (+),score=176.67 TRINITY_DN2597_c0_g1_i1:1-2049(+)
MKQYFWKEDPYLDVYHNKLIERVGRFEDLLKKIEKEEGGLDKFSRSYENYGFYRTSEGIEFREWAPNAREVYLIGEFNSWNYKSHPCKRDEYGRWHTLIPNNKDGSNPLKHNSKIKLFIVSSNGDSFERIPAWIKRVEQTVEGNKVIYDGIYLDFEDPISKYTFKHKSPLIPSNPKIYECHIGMAGEEQKVSSYNYFREKVLPIVKDLGYNCIQIMAVMEHSYYGSFGYQVTNFFAVSSKYGKAEELMEMIDVAHSMGIYVLLDLVHSHASNNVGDGLNLYDGSDSCFFHSGGRGKHEGWDSRVFDYGKRETLRFLVSNVRFFIETFHFDGFRFDGVTSMIYLHHGLSKSFLGYEDYFDGVEEDALNYLKIINYMLNHFYGENVMTIAEEVSGMPGLCRSVEEGGIGFLYRLAMSIPDKWIEYIKEKKDDDWNMGHIVYTLENRRHKEKTIAYCESHDQSLVGDKTIAFWLMDKEMYTNMSVFSPLTMVIDRGLSLHKMIRFITYTLGGEGYLNFMGNEFGHPEWIDFPREGNNQSYLYARRQWSLKNDHLLRYQYLYNFDKQMHHLEEKYRWLKNENYAYVSVKNENDKIIAFEKSDLLFIFNFNPTQSFTEYQIPLKNSGKYKIVFDSDSEIFGGHKRLDHNVEFFSSPFENPQGELCCFIKIYTPCRTCQVYKNFDKVN